MDAATRELTEICNCWFADIALTMRPVALAVQEDGELTEKRAFRIAAALLTEHGEDAQSLGQTWLDCVKHAESLILMLGGDKPKEDVGNFEEVFHGIARPYKSVSAAADAFVVATAPGAIYAARA